MEAPKKGIGHRRYGIIHCALINPVPFTSRSYQSPGHQAPNHQAGATAPPGGRNTQSQQDAKPHNPSTSPWLICEIEFRKGQCAVARSLAQYRCKCPNWIPRSQWHTNRDGGRDEGNGCSVWWWSEINEEGTKTETHRTVNSTYPSWVYLITPSHETLLLSSGSREWPIY